MRVRILAASAAVLAGCGVVAVAWPGSGAVPEAGTHACAHATRQCTGQLEVPLDWANPGSEHISVSFTWIPRRDQSKPATGTVLTLPGGPAPGQPYAAPIQAMLGPVLDRQNMLIMDPRGLGESSPLECPGLDLDKPADIGACAKQLGDRPQFFTSDEAASDFDAVRAALGVDRVSVYSASYGTVWAQAYAARFPQHVKALLMHDVVATDKSGYVDWPLGHHVQNGLANLDSVCAPSRACRDLPSTPRETWDRLVRQLREKPDPALPVPVLVHLPGLSAPGSGKELNAAATAYLRGDPLPLRRLAAPLTPLGGQAGAPPAIEASGGGSGVAPGYFAYLCGDAAHPFSRTGSGEQRRQELDAAYARHNPFGPFTVAEVRSTRADDAEHEDCLDWPTPRSNPPVPPRSTNPDVPVLTVGGEFDVATPDSNAFAVADRFRHGTAVLDRFGLHSPELVADATGLTGEYWLCARQTVRTFLADPKHGGHDELGCSAENYRAAGSFPRTAAELPKALAPGLDQNQRTVVSAAVATSTDALIRRNPYDTNTVIPQEGKGLRGGTLRLPDPSTAELTEYRLVSDVAVTGNIKVGEHQTAHAAELTVTMAGDGTTHKITVDWQPFQANSSAAVTGSIDGRPFRAQVPAL